MNERWLETIEIGKLPKPMQRDLDQWCQKNRSGDPVLTTVERWTVYEIVRVWLDYHSIVSVTHQFLVLLDAIEEGRDAKSKSTKR